MAVSVLMGICYSWKNIGQNVVAHCFPFQSFSACFSCSGILSVTLCTDSAGLSLCRKKECVVSGYLDN